MSMDHETARAEDRRAAIRNALAPKEKIYRCPKGHEVRALGPFSYFAYGTSEKDAQFSGPNCPVCLLEFFKTQFPTELVIEIANSVTHRKDDA